MSRVGLIKVDNVSDSDTKFFAESTPSYYETALGSFKSYGTIGTDGKAGGHIAQQQTDERSANEGLLEVKTTEQAGVPHAEHADEADEHRTDERIHTLLLSVRQKPG
mgnify:CR=1 FL=1